MDEMTRNAIRNAVDEAIVSLGASADEVRELVEREIERAVAVRETLCDECDGSKADHMPDCPTLAGASS
jgi:hypothetical protein